MTLKRSKRSAIIFGVLALVLCISMLIGTTFAWFTDTAKTGINIIRAGVLKVDLYHKAAPAEGETAEGEWISVKDNPNHPIWYYDLWEPGYTQYETVKIVNEGNLALKFKLSSNTSEAEVGDNGEKLSDVIDVYVANGDIEKPESFEALKADTATWTNAGVLTSILEDEDGIAYGVLLPKNSKGVIDEDQAAYTTVESTTMTIALHMREEAGNEYQDLSLGKMFITLVATQETYEEDSFDHKYDEEATYPGEVGSASDLATALANGEDIKLVSDIAFDAGIIIPEGVNFNGNGHTITYSGTEYDYQLVKLSNNAVLENVTLENYKVNAPATADSTVILTNVEIKMDNDKTGFDLSGDGSGTAILTNVTCAGITDAAHLDPSTQVQVDYTPYGDVILGGSWALVANDCQFGTLHGWNTRNGSNVWLNNTTYTVFRMHYWSNRTLYVNGVETAWADSDAIPVVHDVGGCWSVQPAFK